MTRKLATTVFVHHEDGTYTVYEAGSEVPAEDAKKISNPDVWAEDEKSSAKSGK